MDLLYQTHSPYARKVLAFAHEAGLAAELRVIHHETSPTNRNDQVFAVNPLGKVPVLILADGEAIFDSVVICDYLETLNRCASLIPAAGTRRWAALRMQAVAQGMCEAGIGLRWDTSRRPEHLRYPALAEGMKTKLIESYDYLEQTIEFDEPLHVGHIAVATALDWLVFRNLPDFETGRPRLSKWFREFLQRSSMQATPYDGETHD
ncbi:MAG TPA: glutathione S-transferase [Mesorhizobium sp.]|jgi:glutathione S-transferase|uniref:glutathione S-transferase family protein n=1 Tax=Mesorhizobium sp. TaxID=1871066 RepID=UPI002DDDB473|nr:glutathione S-transferase [Mesorhizobium sp.]HEV2502272.1 glutathione S-transferase [Mesorhizobium sp.]